MSEWKDYELGQIITMKNGYAFKSKDFVESGIPIIKIKNVKPNKINFDGLSYISNQNAIGKENYYIKPNDILITMSGNRSDGSPESWVGKVAKFKQEGMYLLNQRVSIINPISELADVDFISYLLSSWDAQLYFINHANSSGGQANISPDIVKQYPILLPPIEEQRAIAAVFVSLDDKINHLNLQNKTLEAMAETIFRQWFVADVNEKFAIGKISDLVEFNPPRKLSKGQKAPYLEMAALNTTVFHPDSWYEREFSSGSKFINGDTLLARITPCLENGKSAFVTFLQENEIGWGSTEYIVMRSKKGLHPFFTYTLVRNKDFREYAEGCLAGSSGRQRVELDHLMNYEVFQPDQNTINQFNQIITPIVMKLHNNFIQIQKLETLRETLLPKLIKGDVSVRQ